MVAEVKTKKKACFAGDKYAIHFTPPLFLGVCSKCPKNARWGALHPRFPRDPNPVSPAMAEGTFFCRLTGNVGLNML